MTQSLVLPLFTALFSLLLGQEFQSTKIDIAYVTSVKLIMGHVKNSKIIQLMLDTLTRLIYRDFSKHFLPLLYDGKSPILSFKTQSSIFYHFTNSYFMAIVKVLFLINYPLEKQFKKGYIFSGFYSRIAFSSNLVGFWQNFYSEPFLGHYGSTLSVTNQNEQ